MVLYQSQPDAVSSSAPIRFALSPSRGARPARASFVFPRAGNPLEERDVNHAGGALGVNSITADRGLRRLGCPQAASAAPQGDKLRKPLTDRACGAPGSLRGVMRTEAELDLGSSPPWRSLTGSALRSPCEAGPSVGHSRFNTPLPLGHVKHDVCSSIINVRCGEFDKYRHV